MCDTINDCLQVMPRDISNNEMPPNSYRGIIIENSETTLQLAGTNEGSHIADIVLTGVPSSGANKHWILTHRGPSLNNRFSIGYTSNNLADFDTLIAAPEQFTLLTNGNIGIGTTNPSTKLEVAGEIKANGIIRATDGFRPSTNDWEIARNGEDLEIREPEQANKVWARFKDDTSLHLIGTPNLWVDGKVGIGTTNPQAKLDVNGDIKVKDWTLSVPDYVFDQDYELRKLDELRTYIDCYKHLPEMPSAQKVSEEGVNLGVFCMSLLKKVEELSLYVLQQDEIIQGQNERLAKLECSASV